MKRVGVMAMIALLVVAAMHAQTPSPAVAADVALQAIFDREWEWELTQDPQWASYLGDRRWNDRWPDMTLAAFDARQAHRQAVLKELQGVPVDRLSQANRVNYEIFKQQYEMAVEGYLHR